MAVTAPTPSPKQPWRDAAMRAWRSKRFFALVLLGIAVILGAYLRFHRLTLADMNGDEGASWAAATAPNLHAVAATEQRIERLGKLALYDFVLHGWVRVFGDSLFTMRALSAGMGTVAIGLLFVAVREVCLCFANEPDVEVAELAGAFAALLFATNVRMVLESRLIRMFSLMLAAEFLQILFFVRAQRKGGFSNYAGITVFSALMIALEFSSSLLLVAEGLWLGVLLLGKWAGARAGRLAIFRPGFAVLAGLGLLVPVLLAGAAASSAHALRVGALGWIHLQPITWPFTVLRDTVGSHKLFWILAALGVLGVWRQWRRTRLASAFFSVWMAGPLLAVLAVTYLIHPLEFYRYVLIAFAGLFALAALGAASFQGTLIRVSLAVVLGFLAVGSTQQAIKHPYQPDWGKAVALAARQTAPNGRIAVFPYYCMGVARFYMNPARRGQVHGIRRCDRAPMLLLAGRGVVSRAKIASMEKCYPHLVRKLFLVEVRSH